MIHNVFNKVINKITLNINFKNNSMNKLFSKINDLQFSYHLYQAIERNEKIRIVNNGDDVRDALTDYISNNSIDISDISDNEFDACVELLQDWLEISKNKSITFSISN